MTNKQKNELKEIISEWYRDRIELQQCNLGEDQASAEGYARGSWKIAQLSIPWDKIEKII